MKQQRSTSIYTTIQNKGFTVVELLIVISVIGILASIIFVAYNGVQDRARAAAITEGFKEINDGFQLMAVEERIKTWWLDEEWWVDEGPSYTGPHDPYIKDVIANTNLKYFLKSVPEVKGLDSSVWRYDNDGNTYDPSECLASSSGVNVFMTSVKQNIAQMVDKSLDDGNLSCGAVRWNPDSDNRLLYSISNTPNFP